MSKGCQKICLSPTRNEAWIINQFLAAAKTWADHVVVADQGSTDGTLKHLESAPGVELISNDSPVYDEAHRQQILLERARTFSGKRILIALDADEALSANFATSKEWHRLDEATPGTVVRFRWVNILPGFKEAWTPPGFQAFGFVDDGSEHKATRIHSPRLPQPEGAPVIDLEDVVVLHFQYVAWERMVSKHRWYQAWESVTHPQKGPLQIFRGYHHMCRSWDKSEVCQAVKPEWLEGYDHAGIDFRSLKSEPVTWWDREIVDMLREHGPERFRRVAIWDKDWNAIAATISNVNGVELTDPRTASDKAFHYLLARTLSRRTNLGVRMFERTQRSLGW